MVNGPDFVRELRRGEEAQVDRLLQLAFGGQDEVKLVRQLRKSKAIAGESVLAWSGEIVGYFALSRMIAPKRWLCLAPVAVHPDWQGKRHGLRMLGLLSEWARLSGTYVVVLGEPGFYERAGFSAARAARLRAPYPVEHLLLAGPGTDAPEVELIYPKAFGAS
ncbi:GNAT family N-acetyltransferase [Thalassovita taeanensis]|uniref:Putative acetyltransferase n=1 Tax=Thalassovita taeanensis TaxID=657014 RepID=A0A1H9I2L0_9RHOB|nr:N-acetyltransferase [Thalassovita taeanensis]SEQ68675.1 putative acetyltransferase [Thalassovita taeanensis]